MALLKRPVLFLFLLLGGATIRAEKAEAILRSSARFVPVHAHDSLLGVAFEQHFSNFGIPVYVNRSRYRAASAHIKELIRPHLLRQFELVGRYNTTLLQAEKGSKAFESVQKQYHRAFLLALRNAVAENDFFNAFQRFDNSDRIDHFHSHIRILPGGKYHITETLLVHNGDGEGQNREKVNNDIQRGIVRTFPISYKTPAGLYNNTTMKVLSVKRNGKPEPWFTRRHLNGIHLYTGEKAQFLDEGFHTFIIEYETENQLYFGSAFDEINWNVTGNGWNFEISKASCSIEIPGGHIHQASCFHGLYGSKEQPCNFTFDTVTSQIHFTCIPPIQPGEGFTVLVSWPAGILLRPQITDRLYWFWQGNKAVIIIPLALVLAFIINFILWWRIGRDRLYRNIYPLFEPPPGLSPAALGFIHDQRFTSRLTVATLLDLAVKRFINISVSKTPGLFQKEVYRISENKISRPLQTGYEDFTQETGIPEETTIVKGTYNAKIGNLHAAVRRFCEENYILSRKSLRGFISLNNQWMAIGNLLGLVAFILSVAALVMVDTPSPMFFLYWLAGLIVYIANQAFFYSVMPAYNEQGRVLKAAVDGFIMYLKAAEEHVINTMNPPAKTPQLYEKYLPYAVALGCEMEWAKQFETVLDKATQSGAYNPVWYRSINGNSMSNSLGTGISRSFGGAISSAATPPSSGRSGSSGGGGFSGGGGGGGGGGGW